MTDRYFYTDAVKAIFMAKNFGMKFESEASGEIYYDFKYGIIETESLWDEGFYIHPDSLPLLEPMAGDLGLDSEGEPHIYLKESGQKPRWHLYTTYDFPEYRPSAIQIIQRDGKAFHWPEKEA